MNTKPQTHLTRIGTKQYFKIIWQNPPKVQDHFKYVYFQMSKWFSFVNLGYRKNLFVLFRYIQKGTWVQFCFPLKNFENFLIIYFKDINCADDVFQFWFWCQVCFLGMKECQMSKYLYLADVIINQLVYLNKLIFVMGCLHCHFISSPW